MTIVKSGPDAQQQAKDWGFDDQDGNLATVVETRKAEHIGCRWVWMADGVGKCMACGDWDSKLVEDD